RRQPALSYRRKKGREFLALLAKFLLGADDQLVVPADKVQQGLPLVIACLCRHRQTTLRPAKTLNYSS
ncbi:MAG TPA: hypothetical protein VG099_27530, partial [Gemmataceae bacterium]|nr:hypothetical protein [Gemmataceae bacterium]